MKSAPMAKALVVALAVTLGAGGTAHAVPFDPFEQSDIDDDWEVDRYSPSSVEVVEAFDAQYALKFTIDPDQAHSGTTNDYHRNEGIRTQAPGSESVEVALYLDPAWEGTAVRAGFWVVGDNGEGAWDNNFGIIEFTHTEVCEPEDCLTHPRNVEQNHNGFRIWDSAIGWTEHLSFEFEYGTWVTLGIAIDTEEQQYVYTIDGQEVGTAGAGDTGINTVFLQAYNFADDHFENLSSEGYTVHWTHEAPVVEEPIEFSDVSETNPFKEEIEWLASTGITGGYEDGTFRPTAAVTRQAMAAFIFRLLGDDEYVAPEEPTFTDVATTHTFYREIEWLAAEGLTEGYADGTYRPTNSISRQAMAAFLFRGFVDDPEDFAVPEDPTFSDVSTDHPFFAQIEWLVGADITTGYDDGTFRGSANVTRQAMAAFLYRFDAHMNSVA